MLDTFLQWLKLNKNSPKTIQSYFQQVNCFGKFCNYEFNQENLNKYLIKLKEENKSLNSINLFKNAFINYCQYANLELEIPSPKRVKRKGIKFYFSEKDMEKIYKIIPLLHGDYSLNDLIIRFMFYTGVRPSELINLKVKDINFETKDIALFNAKGNKDRVVPIINTILFNKLNDLCKSKNSDENVFKINYPQINYLIKKIKTELQLQEKIEPRTFRISFAKHCLAKGMDISYLKKLMGHTDIKITELYAEPDEKMIKEFCEKIRRGK